MLEPKAEPQMERCPPPYDTRPSTADPRLPVFVLSPANRSKEQPQQMTKSAGSKLELALRYISLTLMVVQYVCQVLLTRHASTRPQMPFIKTVAIGIKEALEALISGFLFLLLVRPKRPLALFDAADMLAMLLPALAYTFKNFLLFVAIDHLNAATFTVSYQLKILATALFLVLMMNRRLSSVQWLSLCVLVGGVAIVELQNAKSAMEELGVVASLSSVNKTLRNVSESELNATNVAAQLQLLGHSHESFWVGFGSVLGACVLSGYSGVYLEMVVKRPGDSLWLRNFQLCFLSSLIGLISALFKDFNQIHTQGPLVGFDLLVWAIIIVQVLGGLLVAMVIRYGDNIIKAFANAVAILCISVFSFLFFHCSLGWFFGLGTVLVMSAMCLYSLFPAKEAAEEEIK